jgi:hypothetical protein
MGVILWGESPLCELGSLTRSAYQIIAPIDKAQGKGNCGGATRRGKEARASVARLRTETCYKAGEVRRVGTKPQSRSRTTALVKHGLARRQITLLSGEICPDGPRAVVAPGSRACPKAWNGPAQAAPGGAEVSSGRSVEGSVVCDGACTAVESMNST